MKQRLIANLPYTIVLSLSVAFMLCFPSFAKAESSTSQMLSDLHELSSILGEFKVLYSDFEKLKPKIEAGPKSLSETTAYINDLQRAIKIVTRMLEMRSKVIEINSRLAVLKNQTITSTSDTSSNKQTTGDYRENLTISSLQINENPLYQGPPEPDQRITVVVKNNEFGSRELSKEKAGYQVRVYECLNDTCSDRTRTSMHAEGKFYIPYANGYSEFDVYVEGGSSGPSPTFVDGNSRTYQARVDIDTDDDVTESNERDNTLWTTSWKKYYKG